MSDLLFNRAQLSEQNTSVFYANDCVEESKEESEWYATQWFHTNEPPQEVDEITAVQFSPDGEHLALGDRGGRIWIYSTNSGRDRCKPRLPYQNKLSFPLTNPIPSPDRSDLERKLMENDGMDSDMNDDETLNLDEELSKDLPKRNQTSNNNSNNNNNNLSNDTVTNINNNINTRFQPLGYDFYGQFQSHQPEFDYLKSLEIEERINCISWSKCANNSLSLLAANDKTIKLWKVFEKSMFQRSGLSFHDRYLTSRSKNINFSSDLHLPDIESHDVITAAISRRVFSNGHKFHIHSLSISPDCESFISCDDLRINLWNIDAPNNHFILCDLVPKNMEDLERTITCSFLHPSQSNFLCYTTSDAHTYLCDLRQNCKLLHSTQDFVYLQPELSRDFYSDVGMSIKCGCFSRGDGDKIITRDYYNSYIWDIRSNKEPIVIIPILPYYYKDLQTLYEADLLFDKFNICCDKNGEKIATGMYNNSFIIADWTVLMESKQNLPILTKCELSRQNVFDFQKMNQNVNNNNNNNNNNGVEQNKNRNNTNGINNGFDDEKDSTVVTGNNGNNNNNANGVNDNRDNNNLNEMNGNNGEPQPQRVSWLNEQYFENGDFDNKVLRLSWHPTKDIVAAVNGAALYMYQKL